MRVPARRIVSLNGEWEVAQVAMDAVPTDFDRRVPVPGLLDMAQPPFAEVGTKRSAAHRSAFWYRRSFTLSGSIPAAVRLKIHKALYGVRVLLNGRLVGEHLPCFTPAEFDVRPFLAQPGKANELLIRVGADRGELPKGLPDGTDPEKLVYNPGIYDSVELILSGLPRVANVQTVPDIEAKTVRVVAEIEGADGKPAKVTCVVREAKSGRVAGSAEASASRGQNGGKVDLRIPIPACRLWSPEDPFLYEVEVSTGGDALTTRFGMRSFRLDRKTGFAVLNGGTYFLRGTNVCIFRFFSDPKHGDLAWREDWVRKLLRTFKQMHWNSIRYCIGFPPEMWYRIADEEGLLIQDEFPIWYMNDWPQEITHKNLIPQYTEWMRERWNHPCVVIWDAQNETVANPTGKADAALSETGKAIRAVRRLDLSARPGTTAGTRPSRPRTVTRPILTCTAFAVSVSPILPGSRAHQGIPGGLQCAELPNTGKNPVIINEYGWGHLRRDGEPTCSGQGRWYRDLLWPTKTAAERQELHARLMAAETEFWRAKRQVAGVLHFCGLNYSKPGVVTSDHFADIENLTLEPYFARYVRDAFAPVGLMVDFWDHQMTAGETRSVDVVAINDRDEDWQGEVSLVVVRRGTYVSRQELSSRVPGLGTKKLHFKIAVPAEPGRYQLVGQLFRSGRPGPQSLRDFDAVPLSERESSWPKAGRCRPLPALPATSLPTPSTAKPGLAGYPSRPIRSGSLSIWAGGQSSLTFGSAGRAYPMSVLPSHTASRSLTTGPTGKMFSGPTPAPVASRRSAFRPLPPVGCGCSARNTNILGRTAVLRFSSSKFIVSRSRGTVPIFAARGT